MKTFVTGASGHVGANLVRALIERGEAVKALVRPGSDNAAIAGLDLEQVEGDLRDPASLDRALAGCDRMYHVAAFVSLRAGDQQEIFETNVVGTRNVLAAAERAGVGRSVFCSSFGAIGHRDGGGPSDETVTVNPFETHLDYELSKAIAEIEALRAAARGQDVVIVNPCGVVGPHDYKPSSLGKTILDFANRKMPAYVAGEFEFVAVRDVVAGHLLAMEKGRRGERYILGGEHRSLDQILDHLASLTGVRKPRVRLPVAVMAPVAHVSSFVMKHFFPAVPPRFTPGTVKLLQSGKRADYTKARRELGYQPTSVDAAFAESLEWFRGRGQIRA
ncbi:MAG TPA: SDR family oxidoreductase [Polyangia bacterium]|nr:SDR family oxidoreductase [Polyangia bacterium]